MEMKNHVILKIGESMRGLRQKTIYIMVSTIITIGISLILTGVKNNPCIDERTGFETYCPITPVSEIRDIILLVMLLVMIILGIILMIKSRREKSILVFLVGLISIALSVGIVVSFTIPDPDRNISYKPVLYLYPEQAEKVTVTFEHPENLLTTYPKYKSGWKVTAGPDGSLYDSNEKYYYALYWDEKNIPKEKFTEGFFVTKENAIEFLETTLTQIGLTRREQNEFIMYWLPILEQNKKSIVNYTLTEERQEENELMITPKPDSLLRVAINIKKVDKEVKIEEQELPHFTREGFTAVEWGGTICE